MKRLFSKTRIVLALAIASLAIGAGAREWQVKQEVREVVTREDLSKKKVKAINPLSGLPMAADRRFSYQIEGKARLNSAHSITGVTRSAEEPRGEFTCVVPITNHSVQKELASYCKVNPKNGILTRIFQNEEFVSAEMDYQSGVIRNGHLLMPDILGQGMIVWKDIDLADGEMCDMIDLSVYGWDGYTYAMTWDPEEDIIYGIAFDNATGNQIPNRIVTVDPKNKYFTDVLYDATDMDFLCGICYNPADKNIYLFDWQNIVYRLNKRTGKPTRCGELGMIDSLFEEYTPAIVCYSPKDNCFVACHNDAEKEAYVLYYVDPEDWEVTEGAPITSSWGKPRLTSIHCLDEYANAEAPEKPQAITVDYKTFNLDGSFTFTVPELLYSGVAISESKTVHTVIYLDGKTIINDNFAPGYTETREMTMTQGEHTLTIICDLGEDNVSPETSTIFYTGYDTPNPPTNLRLDGSLLTWKAPVGNVGAHGGYVNPDHYSYLIYVDGERQNTRNTSELQYNLRLPDKQERALIEVACMGDQSLTSARGQLSTVWGKAMTLPTTLSPSKAESELFTIEHIPDPTVAMQSDNDTFRYWADRTGAYGEYNGGVYEGFRMQIGYYTGGNEWLFLPRMAFPVADKLYRFTFDLGGIYTGTTREDFEIWYGTRPESKSMTHKIAEREYHPCSFLPNETPFEFMVDEPGEYYIGIHYRSTKERDGKGMTARNFVVEQTETTDGVPAAPANVKVEGTPGGYIEAAISGKAPSKDIRGRDLAATDKVTINAMTIGAEGPITDQVTVKPGEDYEIYVQASRNGWNQIYLWAENAAGASTINCYRSYLGVDIPLGPGNLRYTVSDDNLSLNMEWDNPGSVGENGGWVDDKKLTYNINVRNGATYRKAGSVEGKTSCLFDHGAMYPGEVKPQYHWTIGPSAQNEFGESPIINVLSEVLGTPNQVPQIENFGTSSFDYSPITKMISDEFAASDWDTTTMPQVYTGEPASLEQGAALLGYLESERPGKGGIIFPKFTTKNTDGHPVHFGIRCYDYAGTPNIYLMGRHEGKQKLEKIGEFKFDRKSPGKWNFASIELPADYQNRNWVEPRIYVDYDGTDQYVIIDTYKAYVEVDKDVKVQSVSGPSQISIGESGIWNVVAANSGLETMMNTTLTARLINAEGKEVANKQVAIKSIPSGRTYEMNVEFLLLAEYGDGVFTVKADVRNAADEMEVNDSKETNVLVLEPQLPFVTDLTGKRTDDDQSAELTWSEPDLTYGNYLDFETAYPFTPTDRIGSWDNITLEPERQSFTLNGLEWPNCDKPQAWTVIDAKEIGLMGDTRLYPHSGKQYLMARALTYNFQAGESPIQSSAWLISPEIVGGTKLSFFMTTANSANPETICIYYSSTVPMLGESVVPGPKGTDTGSTCGEFKWLANFTKSGAAAWELCEVDLPEDAKYVAIVYRSWDEIAAAIDDIVCTPKVLDKWVVDHYALCRLTDKDWSTYEVVCDNIKGHTYTDTDFANSNRSYILDTYVKTEKGVQCGPASNRCDVFSTSVGNVEAQAAIYGANAAVVVLGHAGDDVALYSTDGKLVSVVRAQSDNESIPADAGVYLVKVGKDAVKVVVK